MNADSIITDEPSYRYSVFYDKIIQCCPYCRRELLANQIISNGTIHFECLMETVKLRLAEAEERIFLGDPP